MVILRCVLPQWDLRFPSYKCLKKDILTHTKGSRQKKKRIFYGQADRKGWPPPPPPYGQLFCDFFWGVNLTLVYDYTWFETNFDQKKFFYPLFDPFKDFGWVKMSFASSNKRDNGTKKAMMGSALNMHF